MDDENSKPDADDDDIDGTATKDSDSKPGTEPKDGDFDRPSSSGESTDNQIFYNLKKGIYTICEHIFAYD